MNKQDKAFAANQTDVTKDAESARAALNKERQAMRDAHARELGRQYEKHGRQINAINQIQDEGPYILERRRREATRQHDRMTDLILGIQGREKLKLEVTLKRDWQRKHPDKPFDSSVAEAVLKARHDSYYQAQTDPQADQQFARHQVEFDSVVKDYLDDKTSYESFVYQHQQTVTRQAHERRYSHERELQEQSLDKIRDRVKSEGKAPDI
ncbi:hypothetical protein [Tunicatimonas pelagia]|uniref:hypothetical protein n=1 Tax=Tunicatimonas pelagia TaxID=931531 RepID=UPI002664EA3C|nr:hypothetical protein [Tunicatimonas pelagia]WKN45374.1 hypothetical protein P0M28_10440 [Tunicatimonas pelagia]